MRRGTIYCRGLHWTTMLKNRKLVSIHLLFFSRVLARRPFFFRIPPARQQRCAKNGPSLGPFHVGFSTNRTVIARSINARRECQIMVLIICFDDFGHSTAMNRMRENDHVKRYYYDFVKHALFITLQHTQLIHSPSILPHILLNQPSSDE